MEDDLVGLGEDVREDVQAAAVGHAVHDFLHAQRAAVLDHGFQRRDHGFAAVEAEALRADVLLAEELLVLFAAHDGLKDRLLAFGGELDFLVGAFHALLEEAAFLDIGDVHVFEADLAAVVCAQDLDDLANGRPLKAERAADVDRTVLRSAHEAVVFGGEVGRELALVQAERVQVGGEVTAHAICADQHHRADGVSSRFVYAGLVDLLSALGGSLLDLDLQRAGVEALRQVVLELGANEGPVLALPARPGLRSVERSVVAGGEVETLVAHGNHLHVASGGDSRRYRA